MSGVIALFRAELIKVRRSLILGLALLFPLGLLTVTFLVAALVIKPGDGASWHQWMSYSLVPWACFLLPMLLCLMPTLLLGLEHQNHQWKHLHALPVSRWKHHAAKQLLLGLLMLLAHLLLLAGFVLGGWVLKATRPAMHLEAPELQLASQLLGILFLGSWAMASVHTWLAARFPNLGVNLGVGITGVALITVASQRPEVARFVPWAMPSLSLSDWMAQPKGLAPWWPVIISLAMGTLILGLACWDAGTRESTG